MAIGMSPEEFWHGPLALCGAYRKAWEIQQDQRFASEWRQGLYVHEAFSTVMDHAFSKAATSTYPDAPLFSSQKVREEIEERRERRAMEVERKRVFEWAERVAKRFEKPSGEDG